MKPIARVMLACIVLSVFPRSSFSEQAMGPLRVHPVNPRYFATPDGQAVWLTGSHTWANRQERGIEGATPNFDYDGYLDFMQRHGHNFMRLWAWEQAQWMQFASADVPVRYTPLPYLRTGPGLALDGQPKFDVTKFNDAYFSRLRDRVEAAQARGIYVAVMLFQGFSLAKNRGDASKGNAWRGHPFNKANNINGIDGDPNGSDTGHEVHELKVAAITRLQEDYVRKTIDTLNDLDNVLWEISNESHVGSVRWQYHMIRFIRQYEAGKPKQHVVGMTGSPIRNSALFASPADWISPVGKRYISDPPAADGRKIIVLDTDHVQPWTHDPSWVWKNLLRGNHFILMDHYTDYRIHSPAQPDPKWDVTRAAMGHALACAKRCDLAAMEPRLDLASTKYCLAAPGKEYLVYLPKGGSVTVDLTDAQAPLRVEWMDCLSGKTTAEGQTLGGSKQELSAPFDGPAVVHLKIER